MARTKRIMITLSPAMDIALAHLAGLEDAPESQVARRVLRAGLDRTIHSAAVQDKLASFRANATRDEWILLQNQAAEEMSNECKGTSSR